MTDLPHMNGKICMVTGANAGIGQAVARGLAAVGATVVMVARNRQRGEEALDQLKVETGNDAVHLLLADLSSQQSIREMVTNFKALFSRLDVLINNAGTIPSQRMTTVDGLEMQFAVNHLSYFLLTNLLLDTLKRSAPSRIINVTSQAHQGATIHFDDLQTEQNYTPSRVYARTKLANVLFTYELARRLEGTGVTVNCLHPGVIATKLAQNYTGHTGPLDKRPAGDSPEKGAETPLYLATAPELADVTGKYFVKKQQAKSSGVSYNGEIAQRLWNVSAELTGLPVTT
ncbi:MAG: SDR family oxidoreductase [Chloroflexi bacterium]|nr:SDR family oxidoreductase [Chloroflexota bacterium]